MCGTKPPDTPGVLPSDRVINNSESHWGQVATQFWTQLCAQLHFELLYSNAGDSASTVVTREQKEAIFGAIRGSGQTLNQSSIGIHHEKIVGHD